MDKNKKYVIVLLLLWLVSYITIVAIGLYLIVHQAMSVGSYALPGALSPYHVGVVIAEVIYFLPLAIRINRYAKRAQTAFCVACSYFFIASLVLGIPMGVISIIIELL